MDYSGKRQREEEGEEKKKTITSSSREKGVPKFNRVHPGSNIHKRQPDVAASSSFTMAKFKITNWWSLFLKIKSNKSTPLNAASAKE